MTDIRDEIVHLSADNDEPLIGVCGAVARYAWNTTPTPANANCLRCKRTRVFKERASEEA